MLTPKIAGAIIIGLPLIAIAWALLWRRQRAVFFFALALTFVGLGYLMATGATDDIARKVIPSIGSVPAAKPAG